MQHPHIHSYAAGVVDSDGCIGIRKAYRASGRHTYQAYIAVAQAGEECPDMLKLLHCEYGGSLVRNGKARPGRRQMWRWCVTSRECEAALRLIYKYLVHKQTQADVLLEFRGFIGKPGQRSEGHRRDGQVRLYEKLAAMKHYDNPYISGKRPHGKAYLLAAANC